MHLHCSHFLFVVAVVVVVVVVVALVVRAREVTLSFDNEIKYEYK